MTDPQRRSRPAGEVLQQLAGVAGVGVVAQWRTQRDQADQLAGADQRDEQVDAALAQPVHAWRIEVEVVQQHRSGDSGQVGEQRIVRRQLRGDVQLVRQGGDGSGLGTGSAQGAAAPLYRIRHVRLPWSRNAQRSLPEAR